MSEDNVVKMPDRLERYAFAIDAALVLQADAVERSEEASHDWRRATLDLAVELAKARDEHKSNLAFGTWCDKHFGDNRLPKNERAILVQWGADPEGTEAMLAKTDSRSIQVINSRLPSARKTPSVGGDKTRAVHVALQANEAEGIKLSRKQVAEALNVSVGTVLEAARDLRAARSVEQYTYTKAQDTHVEARVKARLAELEATFEKRVQEANQKQIKILFPDLKAIQDRAALTEKLYRSQLEKIAILTEAEYRDILLCTHEGNPSPETRKRAFIALNAKKLQLTGKA